MKKKLFKSIIILITITILISLINYRVWADNKEKPSINIKIENIHTTDYLIDLLVYKENVSKVDFAIDYNGDGLSEEDLNRLSQINVDGWVSLSTKCQYDKFNPDNIGNEFFVHDFSGELTPEKYKILLINKKTGEQKVSDVVKRSVLNSSIILDATNMKVKSQDNYKTKAIIGNICLVLLIAIIIEISLAFIMKVNNFKIIFFTNLVTNIISQIILSFNSSSYIITYCIMQLVVLLAEVLIYRATFKDVKENKLVLYTIMANLITSGIVYVFPKF